MRIIVDTNIVIYGVLADNEYPECWEILNKIRKQELIPIISEGIIREYMFAPFEALLDTIKEQLQQKTLIEAFLDECSNTLYDYAKKVSKLIMTNAIQINVESNIKILSDVEDNKFINLALDSGCTIIITKNISDFMYFRVNDYLNNNNECIKVYTPDEFLDYYRKLKR